MADAMGVDIIKTINATKTQPFGFTAYYPSIGGHGTLIHPFYFTWNAREYGLHTRFIELTEKINAAVP